MLNFKFSNLNKLLKCKKKIGLTHEKMSEQVISLSSDEEDCAEPPSKRYKPPVLPEVTLTLVTSPKLPEKESIETVLLDSDDETVEKTDVANQTNSKEIVKKTVVENTCATNKVDLIDLIDDEDIQSEVSEVTKTNNTTNISSNVKVSDETVSVDDSDSEIVASTELNTVTNKDKNRDSSDKNESVEVINQSIIIDDSDEETEKENHCENESIEAFPVQCKKTSATDILAASSSKDELEEAKNLFKKFIKMVEEKIVDSAFEEILPKKVPIIRKYFNRSGTYINDKMFKTLLTESITGIKKSTTANGANTAVLAFHKVFEHLKSHVTESTIEVEEDHLPKIKKLERTIKLLRKRIHQLEVAEVNWDDDEDSAYIMLDRYQSRLNKVYAKYCQYIKRNPYHGRATHDRITFVNSSYNVLNQAITRKFKNSLIFPSYYELEKYITKVAKKEHLNLSEAEIKVESKKCFKVLGNIFQKKRRQELYDSHLDFVEFSEDPATKDISLENVLKKNYSEGKEKIEKLYQKYVNKQEKGEDTVSTEDEQSSEDSDVEDDKGKKGKAKKGGKVKGKKGPLKNHKVQSKSEIKDDEVTNEEDIPEKVNGERRTSLKDEVIEEKQDEDVIMEEKQDEDVIMEEKQDEGVIMEEKQDEGVIMEENADDIDDNMEIEKGESKATEEKQANDVEENHIGGKEDAAV